MISIQNLFGKKTDHSALIQGGALVVDVRTREEFASGHYPGSINVPLDALPLSLPLIKEKKKPVITVCRSGARSSAAADLLKKAGIEAFNGGPWTSL